MRGDRNNAGFWTAAYNGSLSSRLESSRLESFKEDSAGSGGENEAAGSSNSILLSIEIVDAIANFEPASFNV